VFLGGGINFLALGLLTITTVPDPLALKGKLTNCAYLNAFVLLDVGILVLPLKDVEGLE
jgi:hypothetical protein